MNKCGSKHQRIKPPEAAEEKEKNVEVTTVTAK
jgi:hypothetical protein